MEKARIGTCSWNFPSWEGLVYENGRKPGTALLAEYARRYDCVEIDRWFWSLGAGGKVRLPERKDAIAYREAVPDDFRFGVKAPNSLTLTHAYRKSKADPLIANPHFLCPSLAKEFIDQIEPLHDVLGPILFQFEYLSKQKMPSRLRFLDSFGEFARQLPSEFDFGLEVRNPSYVDASFFEFLQDLGVAPVLISGYWMASLTDLWAEHSERIRLSNPVIRLMGPDRKRIEEVTASVWNRVVDPHDEELNALARILASLSSVGRQPFLFVNNHYEGSAPLTITRILDRLVDEIEGASTA